MTSRRPLALLLLVPALALAGCGGGGGDEPSTAGAVTAAGPPDAQTATVVSNKSLEFVPETVQAKVGSLALTMTVEGGVPHNLEFSDKSLGAPIPLVPTGSATQTYTFSKAGSYDFDCTIHDGMVGQVIVK